MKKRILFLSLCLLLSSITFAQQTFDRKEVLAQMELANKYFMDK